MNQVTLLKAGVATYFVVTAAIAIFGVAGLTGMLEDGREVKFIGWCMFLLAVALAAFSRVVLDRYETLKKELAPPAKKIGVAR